MNAIETVIESAVKNGWEVNSHSDRSKVFRRGAESMHLFHWSSGEIYSGNINYATGPVSIGRRELHQRVSGYPVDEILSYVTGKKAEDFGPTEYVLVIEEDATKKEDWETASNYSIHKLAPGKYPIEFVGASHNALREGERPYYAIARVPSTIVEEFYVNRLLHASSSHHEKPNKPSIVLWNRYAYEVKDGMTCLNGHGRVERV